MSPKFEAPAFEDLVTEQAAVQADKFQGRLLNEYSSYIFRGQDWREPRSSAVTDFLRPYCQDERVSLEGVLQGMSDGLTRPLHWVEMGGGRGLAMRQLAAKNVGRQALNMTNVDLLDFGLDGLEIEYLEGLATDLTAENAQPRLIQANIETVSLNEPADVITSVEVMQYLNDPIGAICNWYNLLADNGLLIISTEGDWTSWIRYQREPGQGNREETPAKHLLEALQVGGVPFAASAESDYENGFRPKLDPDCIETLVVQKRPGTQLVVNSPVTRVWVNPYMFKVAFYEEPAAGAQPIVEVMAALDNNVTPKSQ
jgi:SAM-dependent methyltransferase